MFRLIVSVSGARLVASLMQAITLLLLTRILGPEKFGLFAALVAAVGVLVVLFGVGLNSLSLRLSALPDEQALRTTIALIRAPVALLAALTASAVALLLTGQGGLAIIVVAGFYAASESLGEGVEALLYGATRERRAQLTMLVRRAALLAGLVVGVIVGNGLAGFSIAIVCVMSLLWLALRGLLGKPAPLSRVFKLAMPLWMPTLLAKMQTLDVVVAASALSPSSAGIYSAAARITSPLNTFAMAALSVLTPRLASGSGMSAKEALFTKSRAGMRLAALALVVCSPGVGWITEIVLGEAYEGVWIIAAILTCMTAFAAVTQIYVSYFYAEGDGMTVAKIRLVVVPLSLSIGWLMANSYGAVALAAVIAASQLALWCALALAYRISPMR